MLVYFKNKMKGKMIDKEIQHQTKNKTKKRRLVRIFDMYFHSFVKGKF